MKCVMTKPPDGGSIGLMTYGVRKILRSLSDTKRRTSILRPSDDSVGKVKNKSPKGSKTHASE